MRAHNIIYTFGPFELDVARRVLRRGDGESIELPPRAFDTLVHFLEHPGRLLEKSELMKAVWPNVFVEENNLNQTISAIRRALGDSADQHRYIATVPGRGYQFVEAVAELSQTTAPPAGQPPPSTDVTGAEAPAESGRRRIGWRALLAFAAGLALLATLSLLTLRSDPAPPHALAVLPFKPLVPDERDPALEFGMADTLITQLSHTRGMTVAPLSSVRRYASVEQDPLVAGRELRVESVLEGHVHRTGDRLRVSVRLLDAANGRPRWARQFDQRFEDIFSVQDVIAASVAQALPGELLGPEAHAKRRTDDPDAYQFYVAARYQWVEKTAPSLQRAVTYFEKAVERDPQYSLAHSGMADCYAVLGVFNVLPPEEAFSKAREAATRALELDPTLAEAHATMGHIKVQYDRDWAAGEQWYRQAIELDPQYAMTYHWLGLLYSFRGEFDQGLEYIRTAQELEPEQKTYSANIGNLLYHAHRYDEAIEQLQHTLGMDEHFELALSFLGRAYLRKGDPERALAHFSRRRFQIKGAAADLVEAHVLAGREPEARAVLAQMHATAKSRYISAYEFATAYAGLREHDAALDWLERAIEEHAQEVGHLPSDPAFDALHGNPRFAPLVERLGLR